MVGPGSKLGRDGPRSKIADRMLSSQLRIRERWIDSDEFVYEMYMVAGDGKEFKSMENRCIRKKWRLIGLDLNSRPSMSMMARGGHREELCSRLR